MFDILTTSLRLKKISFYLFFIPTIAILGSLLFHNMLVSYNFSGVKMQIGKDFPVKLICTEENNYCIKRHPTESGKLDSCDRYSLNYKFFVDGKHIKFLEDGQVDDYVAKNRQSLYNKEVKIIISETGRKQPTCILNSPIVHSLYKFFPKVFDFIRDIKKNDKYTAATSVVVNPLIYGETSISNIVKRFPINFLFKPLLYLTSVLMILYWIYYQKIFSTITKNNNTNIFLIFGIISGIFLFFHVFFLGTTNQSEIFTKIRKIIVLTFLFAELFAQYFLVRKIYQYKDLLLNFTIKNILFSKIYFVAIILIFTIIAILYLIFYKTSSEFNNILEWNYFLVLLLFYLLSSIMWKKKITN